jgi:alpha-1,6-mannosyltransferase
MNGIREKLILFSCSLIYFYCAYFINRSDFEVLVLCYFLLFSAYIYVSIKATFNYKEIIAFAVFFRLIFLFSIPPLSDDFYRFVWDGRMIFDGINPYLVLPSEFIQTTSSNDFHFLFENMNSQNYFTVYPPFNQLLFGLASLLGGGSIYFEIIILRSFIILAEIGTMLMLPKLLTKFNLNKNLSLFYILNPLIIIELTGNLHFEGVMIFFIIAAIYFLVKNQLLLSSLFWALAIGTKLIPLIFLPVLIKVVGVKKSLYHFIITAFGCILMFLPFLSNELISNFFSSLDLYFQSFEFNASIYFLVREVGYWIKGWNTIQFIGPAMAIITFLGIISILLFFKRSLTKAF